jgi:hypothetical protein
LPIQFKAHVLLEPQQYSPGAHWLEEVQGSPTHCEKRAMNITQKHAMTMFFKHSIRCGSDFGFEVKLICYIKQVPIAFSITKKIWISRCCQSINMLIFFNRAIPSTRLFNISNTTNSGIGIDY